MKSKKLLKLFPPYLPKTKKELDLIKRKFLMKDLKFEKNDGYGISNVNFNDSSILVKILVGRSSSSITDEFGFIEEVIDLEHDVIKVDFKEEFKEELSLGLEIYCSKFRSTLYKKNIFTEAELEGFKKMTLKTINDRIEYYSTKSDLPDFFKDLIIAFYSDFYSYISAFSLEEIQISDKLKFNLKKNQVILLFQTMFDKGVMSGMSQLDLYRILDEKTMYTKNGVYVDMKNTRTQANKLQKSHVSSAASIQELSQLIDENFFTTTA